MQSDMVVMKFGGTSVAGPEQIKRAAARIVASREAGNRVVAVLSARGKTTDGLVEMAYEISDRPDPREMDMLLSTGERISCALCAMVIRDMGHEAISLTGSQAGIVTDSSHTKARIIDVRADRIREALDADRVVLVAGFQVSATASAAGEPWDTGSRMEIGRLGRALLACTAAGLMILVPPSSPARVPPEIPRLVCLVEWGERPTGQYRYRPHRCDFHERGAYPAFHLNIQITKGLQWRYWGRFRAMARGKLGITSYGWAPTKIVLNRRRLLCGQMVFTLAHFDVRIRYNGRPDRYRYKVRLDDCLV